MQELNKLVLMEKEIELNYMNSLRVVVPNICNNAGRICKNVYKYVKDSEMDKKHIKLVACTVCGFGLSWINLWRRSGQGADESKLEETCERCTVYTDDGEFVLSYS